MKKFKNGYYKVPSIQGPQYFLVYRQRVFCLSSGGFEIHKEPEEVFIEGFCKVPTVPRVLNYAIAKVEVELSLSLQREKY